MGSNLNVMENVTISVEAWSWNMKLKNSFYTELSSNRVTVQCVILCFDLMHLDFLQRYVVGRYSIEIQNSPRFPSTTVWGKMITVRVSFFLTSKEHNVQHIWIPLAHNKIPGCARSLHQVQRTYMPKTSPVKYLFLFSWKVTYICIDMAEFKLM